jgi:hypothetical protein
MSDISNVQLGVCSVLFNGVDLGHTKGGVEVSYEPVYQEITVDKYGETVVEKVLTGEKLSAKVPLAEFTIPNLKVAIPAATFAGAADARVTVGKSAGAKASASAAQLVLHPISEGTKRHDVVFYKAHVSSQIVLAHKNDEQKIIEVEFTALLDESKSDGNYLGLLGDSTK